MCLLPARRNTKTLPAILRKLPSKKKMNIKQIIDLQFQNILKNNSEDELDIISKGKISLDFDDIYKSKLNDKIILETNILELKRKIGTFKLILDLNHKVIDEFFTIN